MCIRDSFRAGPLSLPEKSGRSCLRRIHEASNRVFYKVCLLYTSFSGVKNYIALIGKKSPNLEEACGYYGEKIVLRAQQLGLNTLSLIHI